MSVDAEPNSYALFLIPSQIIITHVRPSLWLPALEFGWGILTLFMYAVKDAKQVYALRAFVSYPQHPHMLDMQRSLVRVAAEVGCAQTQALADTCRWARWKRARTPAR